MFTQNLKRGFTLIELLVVIAIIGILASVVLASLNTARAKGADAAIKTNLANMRAQSEIAYDNIGCYSANTVCTALVSAVAACAAGTGGVIWQDNQIEEALNAAGKASNGTDITAATCAQAVNNGAWAISVPLKSNTARSWCIDSTGSSKERATGAITTTNC